jgi:hypothetical protein
MNEAIFYKVKSFTVKDKEYIVRKMLDGSWRCECPAFVFRQKKCNHIRKLQHLKIKK